MREYTKCRLLDRSFKYDSHPEGGFYKEVFRSRIEIQKKSGTDLNRPVPPFIIC
jgi:predicted cupin superfamily sugar epimerase